MESLDLPCLPGASCLLKTYAHFSPTSIASALQQLHRQRKMLRPWTRANLYLQPTAPVVTATEERATGLQRVPLLHHQRIFTLRGLQKKEPGIFWKMACQERQCRHGRANSAQISGAPWSN